MAEGSWQGSSHCLIFPRGTGNSVLPSLLGTLRRPSPVQPGLAGDPGHSSAPLCINYQVFLVLDFKEEK